MARAKDQGGEPIMPRGGKGSGGGQGGSSGGGCRGGGSDGYIDIECIALPATGYDDVLWSEVAANVGLAARGREENVQASVI